MKIKLLSAIVVLLLGVSNISAQELKIGYTSPDYILSLMPEAKQIEAELKAYEKQLQNQLTAKDNAVKAKVAEYQENAGSWDQFLREGAEKEIQDMQKSLQEFAINADNSLSNKRNQLLGPVYEKIGKTIRQVAEENNFTHVFSAGTMGVDILLHAREEDDISNLVLAKLGITPPAADK